MHEGHAAELTGAGLLDRDGLAKQRKKTRTLAPRRAELAKVGAREAHMWVPK